MLSRVVIVFVALGVACGGSPSQPLSPTPTTTPSRVSGVVVDDETSVPVANASVTVAFRPSQTFSSVSVIQTRTNQAGYYEVGFTAGQNYSSDALALVSASAGTTYWANVQLAPGGESDVAKNIRLRRVRTATTGNPFVVSIEPDSSFLWDVEWDPWTFVDLSRRWEELRMSGEATGTLTIEARSLDGGPAPTLRCPYGGCPLGGATGMVSFPVRAPWQIYFSIDIASAAVPGRYEVTTSVRP